MRDEEDALAEGDETETGTDPRGARKRESILDAAASVFLRNGYVGTSMDEIAAAASVSKQTVYKHFVDKKQLFTDLVTTTARAASDAVLAQVLELRDTGDVAADLGDLARRLLENVMVPRLLQLRRLVIGESSRFPELARTYYELGPQRAIGAVAEGLEQLDARGVLAIDDTAAAAEHFNWLVLSTPLNRAMFLGDDAPHAGLEHYAEGAVRVFLAAYGQR